MTRPIDHWTIDDKSGSGRVRWITSRANLLIRRCEEKWCGDDVLLTRAKTKSVACTRRVEKRVQPICQGICRIGRFAIRCTSGAEAKVGQRADA